MLYAVTDIETTGGRSTNDKITEVAIYVYDDEKQEVVNSYHSLVDPECSIPPFITSLTGIDDDMVSDAPTFYQIADDIEAITKDTVFVAHNVSFDYNFIRKEFNRIDRKFQRKKLCTVRLSRKLLPGFPSYSLGKLCVNLGIEITDRHRAHGDAIATVEVLKRCLEKDEGGFIPFSLKPQSKEALMPPNLKREVYDKLPKETGIYYFYDQQGKVLYIGKAKNIQSRVSSHFSANTNTSSRHNFLEQVYDVGFELCGGEMLAEMTEAHAIKKHWPPFNRSLKRIRLNYGIYAYEDRNGYGRFAVAETSKTNKALLSFKSEPEAFHQLRDLVMKHELCPRLGGVQFTVAACHGIENHQCNGACIGEESAATYNPRYVQAKNELLGTEINYILVEKGRNESENGIVLVEQGRYKGFGYVPTDANYHELDDLRELITPGYDDQDMQNILRTWAEKRAIRKVVIN